MIENDTTIHPTAVIEPGARIAAGVTVGPYATIGPEVEIGPGSQINAHTVIEGRTRLGSEVKIGPFASVGTPPQDIKYQGEPTRAEIGDRTVIREFVTVNRGTAGGGGITRVGQDCLLMAYCHVAHDCLVGDHVIMANGATLGGHVVIGEHVIIGGLSAIHQFCHIGAYAFLGGMSGATKDIPPFVKFWGQRGKMYGLNLVGLRRHAFPRDAISALRDAYRMIFKGVGTVHEALGEVRSRYGEIAAVRQFLDFIEASRRGVAAASAEDEGEE